MHLPAEFAIGDRMVGPGHPTYVIAEAGANHNRDWDTARRLIDVAAEAGADAVKFQTYCGATIYSTKTPPFKYLEPLTDQSPSELLEDISLPREWQAELDAYARERGLHFFSTPFDAAAVGELDALDVPVLKIASFEIVDVELIRARGRDRPPADHLDRDGGARRDRGRDRRGRRRRRAGGRADAVHVGLSGARRAHQPARDGHAGAAPSGCRSASPTTRSASRSRSPPRRSGAAFVEKHFTLDRTMSGPDHPFAVEPRRAARDGRRDPGRAGGARRRPQGRPVAGGARGDVSGSGGAA